MRKKRVCALVPSLRKDSYQPRSRTVRQSTPASSCVSRSAQISYVPSRSSYLREHESQDVP